MHLSEINIYPIKSCKGISLTEAKIERRGLEYDRRWMLVDKNDWFVTQRKYSKMATIAVALNPESLIVTTGEGISLTIPLRPEVAKVARVRIWRNRVRAEAYGSEVNEWFSDVLGAKLRLVYMPDTSERLAHAPYKVHPDDVVSFADGYPFFLLGEGSVEDLNRRLESRLRQAGGPPAVPGVLMNRFRPNFVVAGSEPYAEDAWKRFRIGKNVFYGVKLCGRCVITTVDQTAGVKTGPDPLRTLAKYRTMRVGASNKIAFGQNLIAENSGGVVRVGDPVVVLEGS